jgi:hypothetical protein
LAWFWHCGNEQSFTAAPWRIHTPDLRTRLVQCGKVHM